MSNVEYSVSQYVGDTCIYIRRIYGPYTEEERKKEFENFQKEHEAYSYTESNMSPIWEYDEED